MFEEQGALHRDWNQGKEEGRVEFRGDPEGHREPELVLEAEVKLPLVPTWGMGLEVWTEWKRLAQESKRQGVGDLDFGASRRG